MALKQGCFRKNKNKVINVRAVFGIHSVRKSIAKNNRAEKDIFPTE